MAIRLLQSREARGCTLRGLAERAGLSAQAVLYIEQAKVVPKVDTCELLAVALDVAPGWLAYGEGAGQSEQLEKVAEAVYVVARESMMQAGLQRVAVTNKAAIWKVTAERPAAGSAQTSMSNRQVPAAAEPSEYK